MHIVKCAVPVVPRPLEQKKKTTKIVRAGESHVCTGAQTRFNVVSDILTALLANNGMAPSTAIVLD